MVPWRVQVPRGQVRDEGAQRCRYGDPGHWAVRAGCNTRKAVSVEWCTSSCKYASEVDWCKGSCICPDIEAEAKQMGGPDDCFPDPHTRKATSVKWCNSVCRPDPAASWCRGVCKCPAVDAQAAKEVGEQDGEASEEETEEDASEQESEEEEVEQKEEHNDPEAEKRPTADPSAAVAAECHKMRTAYEITPGRGWGKMTNATLRARWDKLDCEELEKRRTGVSRCGFTWDDAAAKSGLSCNPSGWDSCTAPKHTVKNPSSYWYKARYQCYTDLPELSGGPWGQRRFRVCRTVSSASTDEWCTDHCNTGGVWCDPSLCDCAEEDDSNRFTIPDSFNMSAPIQTKDKNLSAWKLPPQSKALVNNVVEEAEANPSGLPSCPWRPSLAAGINCSIDRTTHASIH